MTAPCPACSAPLRRDGGEIMCAAQTHRWTPAQFAAEHPAAPAPDPLSLADPEHETVLVTVSGAWMVRRPRGHEAGWLLDLAGAASGEDWHLLHVRGRGRLDVIFAGVDEALGALRAALSGQVRTGQVWRHRIDGERVQVTKVDHFAGGPDGTVYVRSLDTGQAWSPGDFRRCYDKLADAL